MDHDSTEDEFKLLSIYGTLCQVIAIFFYGRTWFPLKKILKLKSKLILN